MEPLSALNLIERFEEYMFLMYDSWARSFASDPWASELFSRMKMEEIAHRSLVQKQRNVVLESGGFVGEDIKLDIMAMNSAMDMINESTQSPPRDLKLALEIAYTIESGAAEQYAFTALKDLSDDLGELLDEYTERFGDHFSGLLDAIRKKRLKPVSPDHGNLVQLRVPYAGIVTVRDSLTATGCNISDGGIYLGTTDLFEVGQILPVTIPLPGGSIKVEALVKHVQAGSGVGLQFQGLGDEQSSAISSYIDRIASGEKVEVPHAATAPACEGPVAVEPAAKIHAKPVMAAPTERVVIVNNAVFSDHDIQMFVSTLRDAGMDVQVLRTESQTLEAISEEDIIVKAVIVAAETINDDGFSVIGVIRRNPAFSHLPLMVLSTSYDKRFINRVLSYGANFAHKMSLTPEALLSFLKQ